MHPQSLADVRGVGLSTLALALALGTGAAALSAADLSDHYTWNSVMIGGGGWGALVFESPAAPGVVYFKDDCSSVYRLDERATVVHYENGDPRNIRSSDGGRTWSRLQGTLPCQWDGNVAVSRNDPNRFLIGQCTYDVHWYGFQGMSTDRYLKLTTDGGATFTDAIGSGTIHMWGGALYGGNAMNLCADPNVDNRFVAFSNYDFYVYASDDGGAHFKAINTTRPFAVENGVWAKIFGIPGASITSRTWTETRPRQVKST